jgi:hypothetical protein
VTWRQADLDLRDVNPTIIKQADSALENFKVVALGIDLKKVDAVCGDYVGSIISSPVAELSAS